MSEFEKWFNGALKLLSFRPRSQKEILSWLEKKKILPTLQKKIISKLEELNFLNDEEFMKWWFDQRTNFRPMGKRRIEMELKQKGISRELISNFQFPMTNEIDLAKKAAEKKMRLWQNLPPDDFRQKLFGFLARRGFSWETIKKTIDEILKKE